MEYREDIGFQIRTLSHLVKRTVDQAAFDGWTTIPPGCRGGSSAICIETGTKRCSSGTSKSSSPHCRSTVTGILQLMEKNGLITRSSVEQDARLKKLELTPRAIELHERIERSVRQVEERISHCLTPEEKETFIQLCEKIRADLSQ